MMNWQWIYWSLYRWGASWSPTCCNVSFHVSKKFAIWSYPSYSYCCRKFVKVFLGYQSPPLFRDVPTKGSSQVGLNRDDLVVMSRRDIQQDRHTVSSITLLVFIVVESEQSLLSTLLEFQQISREWDWNVAHVQRQR